MASDSQPGAGKSIPSTSTPEYVTLRKCYKAVIDHVKEQPGAFCDVLFASGYIPSSVRDYTRNDFILDDKKAQKLVDTVIDRIEHTPSVYHGFLKVMKGDGPWTKDIIEQLQECYEAEMATLVDTEDNDCSCDESFHSLPEVTFKLESSTKDKIGSRESSLDVIRQTTGTKTSKSGNPSVDPAFACPYCKKCSLEQFLSEQGCPEATGKTLFPYLHIPALSAEDRDVLEDTLVSDTDEIRALFADTDTSIAETLKADVTLVKNYALDLVADLEQDENEKKLEKADSIPSIILALQPYKSFLNYKVIDSIVAKFGSPENKEAMQNYVSAFDSFCKRSAFEVPKNIFPSLVKTRNQRVLSVKLTSKGYASLKDVVSAKHKIASILGVKKWALRLCSIEEGCICLRFLIQAQVADKVFPLLPAQTDALIADHIRVLGDPKDWCAHVDYSHSSTLKGNVQSPNPQHEPLSLPHSQDPPHDPPLAYESCDQSQVHESHDPPLANGSHDPPPTHESHDPPPVQDPPSPPLHDPFPPEVTSLLQESCYLSPSPPSQRIDPNKPTRTHSPTKTKQSLAKQGTKNLSEQLIEACKRGSVSEASSLIEKGADMDYSRTWELPGYETTPPLAACGEGHTETAQLLIDKGANVNMSDPLGDTPLLAACVNGHTETAQMLTDKGADMDKCDEYTGSTPLLAACRNSQSETAQLLIDKGADFKKPNKYGKTPLLVACEEGLIKIAQLLIDKGADMDKCDELGKSILLAACLNGHSEIAHQLINKGANVNPECNYVCGTTPLVAACLKGLPETAKLLIDKEADVSKSNIHGITPLLAACQEGLDKTAKLLIDKGADVSKHGRHGTTPLLAACQKGLAETAKLLIDKGADVSKHGRHGTSPLLAACQEGLAETAQLLTNRGADVNKSDKLGTTPLIAACERGLTKTAQMLIDKGADVSKSDKLGTTPLIAACENGLTKTAQMLIDKGADVNKSDKFGTTPLIAASKNGLTKTAQLLIDRGADVRKSDESLPLVARREGYKDIEHIRYVLKKGAKQKPLHEIVGSGYGSATSSNYSGYGSTMSSSSSGYGSTMLTPQYEYKSPTSHPLEQPSQREELSILPSQSPPSPEIDITTSLGFTSKPLTSHTMTPPPH